MSLRELFRAAVESIRAHKLRSFLTLLGIIIGVTTVVGVASVISGLNAFVQEKVIRLAPDVFVVTKFGIIRSRDEFLDALKRPDFTPRDFDRLGAVLTRVVAIGADVTTQSAVKYRDRRLGGIPVHGCTANYAELLGKDIEAGRWFVDSDDLGANTVAVIGWDVKDELFRRQDPIGRALSVGGVPFRIVGVITQQGSALGQTEDNHVYVPLSTFRKAWGTRNSIDMLVKARGGVPGVPAAADEVRSVIRALRHTPFRSPDPFGLITADQLQDLWRQVSTAAFVLTILIASVSLGVGGIVIMNIMLVGVVERTREIGVRLALGARKRDIRRQFLLEAALLSTAGGLIGVAVGASAPVIVRQALNFPAQLTPSIVTMGLGLSTLVGIAAGYWPARSASNLPVVDALRDET
ncbi:MAG TPA: ABC transporter permease [Candidatus Polarisedimenticolaceae bacterium]|nr:ABC transporter permease [Candidatus Polarisedimenticolaceae bacterium]